MDDEMQARMMGWGVGDQESALPNPCGVPTNVANYKKLSDFAWL